MWWVPMIFAMMASVLVAGSGTTSLVSREIPTHQREAMAVAAKLRTFAWAAATYITYNASANGAIGWATIAAHPATPPAIAGTTIPASWYMAANGAGGYVLCTEIPEITLASIAQLMPGTHKPLTATNGKIVFAATQSEANTEAIKCG